MCFPQLIADPLEAQMAGSAIAFNVRCSCDLIAVFHIALVHAIRRAQEHAAMFAGRGHFVVTAHQHGSRAAAAEAENTRTSTLIVKNCKIVKL